MCALVDVRVFALHFAAFSLFCRDSPVCIFYDCSFAALLFALAGARIPAGKEVAKAALLAKQGASASSSKHTAKAAAAAAAEDDDEDEDDDDEDVVMTNASSKKNAKAMSAAGRAALASGTCVYICVCVCVCGKTPRQYMTRNRGGIFAIVFAIFHHA